MDKRELIERICLVDPSARVELLANYSEEELQKYVEHWEALLEARELVAVSEE